MSRNGYWYIGGGVLLGIAFLVSSPYMAYCAYAFVLLLAVAHLSSYAWLAGLDCERRVSEDSLQQGDQTEVTVTLTNRRGWPIPWIYLEDRYPVDCTRSGEHRCLAVLMPGQQLELRYRLTCPRRGYHRIGPLLMESGDLFGLQRRFRTGKQQNYVSVLPTIAYIETFNIATKRPQGPVKISNRIYEDPTRIAGLREYQPGDPLNRIHWKASARTGELFTKTHEPATVLGGTLILDLHGVGYPLERREEMMELAITTTASIAYLLQMSGEQVGMITNALDAAEVARYEVESHEALSRAEAERSIAGEGDSDRLNPLQVPTLRSPIQAQQIAENLARVLPGHGLTADNLVLSEFRRLPRDAALLPVTPQVSPALALVLGEMKLNGFAVSVFLVGSDTAYRDAASLLAPHTINVFHIEHERDLHELSPARIGH